MISYGLEITAAQQNVNFWKRGRFGGVVGEEGGVDFGDGAVGASLYGHADGGRGGGSRVVNFFNAAYIDFVGILKSASSSSASSCAMVSTTTATVVVSVLVLLATVIVSRAMR